MTVKELLAKEGISEASALREQALLVGLAKSSHFEAEYGKFEKKYGISFQAMKRKLEKQRNKEDFEIENDMLEWEFADSSLRWCREKIKEAGFAY